MKFIKVISLHSGDEIILNPSLILAIKNANPGTTIELALLKHISPGGPTQPDFAQIQVKDSYIDIKNKIIKSIGVID